jgi:hypothetical protein
LRLGAKGTWSRWNSQNEIITNVSMTYRDAWKHESWSWPRERKPRTSNGHLFMGISR